MRAVGAVRIVLGVSLLVGADAGESARDLAALQGGWRLVSSEVNGESMVEEAGETERLTIAATRFAVRRQGTLTSYSIRLEPSSDPKALELTIESGPVKGQVLKGIYKLDGDLFTICHGLTPKDDRPVEFSTGAESGHTLKVWRRVHSEDR